MIDAAKYANDLICLTNGQGGDICTHCVDKGLADFDVNGQCCLSSTASECEAGCCNQEDVDGPFPPSCEGGYCYQVGISYGLKKYLLQ